METLLIGLPRGVPLRIGGGLDRNVECRPLGRRKLVERVVALAARATHNVARRVGGDDGRVVLASGVDERLEEEHPGVLARPIAALGCVDESIGRHFAAQIAVERALLVTLEMLERDRGARRAGEQILKHRQLHRVRGWIVVTLADEGSVGCGGTVDHIRPNHRLARVTVEDGEGARRRVGACSGATAGKSREKGAQKREDGDWAHSQHRAECIEAGWRQ